MSRPPRPVPQTPTAGDLIIRDGRLDYLPLAHGDFVELERLTAVEPGELEMVPAEEAGDLTATLFDASALVAHVLAVYQDRYAGEAFLATARSAHSLVKHGRRLGYEPDPGLSATGFAVLEVSAGLTGTVPLGLGLASVPFGETKAQDFETLDAVAVNAGWNELRPVDAALPTTLASATAALRLAGVGHGLSAGERVAVVTAAAWQSREVAAVLEDQEGGFTELVLDAALPALGAVGAGDVVLAEPTREIRLFGWNADAAVFPPGAFASAGGFSEPDNPPTQAEFGYLVDGTAAPDTNDLFTAQQLADDERGEHLVRIDGTSSLPTVALVKVQANVALTFMKAFKTTVATGPTTTDDVKSHVWLSGPSTRLELTEHDGTPLTRASQSTSHTWLGGWRKRLPLAATVPNPAPVAAGDAIRLPGDLQGLAPGRLVALATVDGETAQIVELIDVVFTGVETVVRWRERTAAPPGHVWTKGDLVLLGNVAPISHGAAAEEILGDSDGVTPFLRFSLKKSPVTHLPGADGGEPALEIRVANVAWSRVEDFADSGPDDRHYLLQRSEAQVLTVIFGDGLKGAVPPAGRKHIRARYRVGLGEDGNVAAGGVSRVKRAHPLVERARNPTALAGGTAPAAAEDVRRQATRYIRTFDRAVSLTDHADLALLFPGVARATAYHDDLEGLRLVVATAAGDAIADKDALRRFLEARRDTSLALDLVDPLAVDLFLSITFETDAAFLRADVEAALRRTFVDDDLPGLFTFPARGLGQPAHASEVYRAASAVPGVSFVELTHLALTPASSGLSVNDVVRVAPAEWLRLPPQNLAFTAPGGGAP